MTPRIVYVDTAAMVALINVDDELHAAAVLVERKLTQAQSKLVTSDWVLVEFLCLASKRNLRGRAAQLVASLQRSRRTRIIPATHADFQRAFDLFRAREDKEWSLVDCSSILICEDEGIQDVFSHDRHFVQAGLRVLL